MRKNAARTIEAFLAGKPCRGDSKRTIHTDGRILYSYALPIAARGGEGTIVLAEVCSPSRTTTGQIRAARYMVPGATEVSDPSVLVSYAAEWARGEAGPAHAKVRTFKVNGPTLRPSRRAVAVGVAQ